MQRAQASQPQIRACFPLHADTERKLFLLKRNSSQQGLWLILSSQLMIKGNRSAATVFKYSRANGCTADISQTQHQNNLDG